MSIFFHSDRGNEFDNRVIDSLLEGFDIQRSLSDKGCPYDKNVAESIYKSLKIELVYSNHFASQNQLSTKLFDYVHWWNYFHIHGTLNYETPINYRLQRQSEACFSI